MSTATQVDTPVLLGPDGAATRQTEAPQFHRRARLALALALLLLGAWTLRGFLPALAWAVILAVATWPLYRRAEKRFPPGRHNVLLPAVFTLGVALVFLVPLALAAVQLGHEAHNLFHFIEDVKAHGLPTPGWLRQLPLAGAQASAWWDDNLADPGGYSDLIERMNHGSVLGYTRQLGTQLIRRSVTFAFTLMTLFFLYREGHTLQRQMLRASTRALGPHGERVGRQMVASVHGTVDGLVLVGLGEGVLLGIAYFFAGVPHPTLLGAATGIAAMIPFAAVAIIAIVGVVMLASGSVPAAIAVVVFGYVVVFVADHFIRPALIGGATKLPFIWVLLGILGGVETWGLLGLFLGPALMAALVLLWRDWSGGGVTTASDERP